MCKKKKTTELQHRHLQQIVAIFRTLNVLKIGGFSLEPPNYIVKKFHFE